MTKLPGLRFDPRDVGPVEIVRRRYERLEAWVEDNDRMLIGAAVVLAVVLIWAHVEHGYTPTLPQLPTWLLIFLSAALFVGIPPGLWLGWRVTAGVHQQSTELLAEVNPQTGDVELTHIDPRRFRDIQVFNMNGEPRDRSFLQQIIVNGHTAWEVDHYNLEHNVAIASSMAGRTNIEVRRDRTMIRTIKTSLESQADKALDLIANHSSILRQHARVVTMHLSRVSAEVDVAEGGLLFEQLEENIDTEASADELLEQIEADHDGTDAHDQREFELEVEGPGGEPITIHERAAAESNGADDQDGAKKAEVADE